MFLTTIQMREHTHQVLIGRSRGVLALGLLFSGKCPVTQTVVCSSPTRGILQCQSLRHKERYTMLCPRCGDEWDATKSSCSSCGFTVRTSNPSGSAANFSTPLQRGKVSPGGNPPPMGQQSGSMPVLRSQSGGLSPQALPNTPRPMHSAPLSHTIPPHLPHQDANFPTSSTDMTVRPAFEKNVLRRVSTPRDMHAGQAFPQTPPAGMDTLSFQNRGQRPSPSQPGYRTTDYLQQDVTLPSSQPHANGVGNSASRMQQSGIAFQQQGMNAPTRMAPQPSSTRPLLPGALLRGNRYRLQELQERQDWLSGVFEATWVGKDSHRAGGLVTICEVMLPEGTSVMTQSILRTATITLANVGRHPRIPALWDAFSDQGRSFFVFEPIEGESLYQRLRYSGRPLSEQEAIECCLQMTEVLELLSQQSPQIVHGLIRPEHIVVGRNGSHFFLTNFSIVLAGGATQFIAGMERSRLSPYAAPEFVRGVVDARTDMYSLIATAYHAATGVVPTGITGSIPPAQRINHALSSEFDAILTKGLRAVANQRYQRPSELRQDLLALRSVSGSLVSSSPASRNGQRVQEAPQRNANDLLPPLPIRLTTDDADEERVLLLPRPEDLPPMKASDDRVNAALLLSAILVCFIVLVILSQTFS
ncbi:MAG: hypothetical protein E6I93_07350 [Chloroflexi bacterium]|nr:MAG: hypothetical protein E6I93_07350 [Chloroflexota bacterium]